MYLHNLIPKKAEDGNIYASIIPPMATAVGVGALAGLEDQHECRCFSKISKRNWQKSNA